MNVVVYLCNSWDPIFFEDATFTIGLNVNMDRVSAAPVERNVTVEGKDIKVREFTVRTAEYMDNKMLCIHRGKPAPDKPVRTTVVFAPGQWSQVWDADDPSCPYRSNTPAPVLKRKK